MREDYDAIKDTFFGTAELETKRQSLQDEMNVAAELIGQCVTENARTALDQTEYQKKYSGFAERFNKAKDRLSEVSRAITERQAKRERTGRFVSGWKNWTARSWHSAKTTGTALWITPQCMERRTSVLHLKTGWRLKLIYLNDRSIFKTKE